MREENLSLFDRTMREQRDIEISRRVAEGVQGYMQEMYPGQFIEQIELLNKKVDSIAEHIGVGGKSEI